MMQMKGKPWPQESSRSQMVEPLSACARNFIEAFEKLASTYEDEDLEADAMKSLCTTAGSLVSMALNAGLFTEYRSSLEIEYQHGLKESESKGWRLGAIVTRCRKCKFRT